MVLVDVICLLHLANSQCTLDQLNNGVVEMLTANSITATGAGTVTVTVQDFSIVCLAIGTDFSNFRFASLVVQYSCVGSQCPSGKLIGKISRS